MSIVEKLAEVLGCNPDGSVTIDIDVDTDTDTFYSHPKIYRHIHTTMPDDKLDRILAIFKEWLNQQKITTGANDSPRMYDLWIDNLIALIESRSTEKEKP